MPLENYQPKIIRHNYLFLNPRGLSDGLGPPPPRPLPQGYHLPRYHDMVRETIYMKGSSDVARIGKHLASKAEMEAEQMEWSKNRFRKQRETAALWQDMSETFKQISGHPQGERPATPEALPPQSLPAGATPSHGSAKGSAAGLGSTGRASIASQLFEELSSLGLARPGAGGLAGGRSGASLRGLQHSASEPNLGARRGGSATLMGQSVVRQSQGTRGLPVGFRPAVPMHMGIMMFPKNLAYHYADEREQNMGASKRPAGGGGT